MFRIDKNLVLYTKDAGTDDVYVDVSHPQTVMLEEKTAELARLESDMQALIEKASKEAKALIDKAQAEARRMLLSAHDEAERIGEDARNKGYAEGQRKAASEWKSAAGVNRRRKSLLRRLTTRGTR